ncbi:hypothetical protein EDD21DRAFT_239775 [Dissophora ornata]|nr:hypothetical protein EDD21DRAFT_239775 [Dissophora ornata]
MMMTSRAVQPLLAPLVQASTASFAKIDGDPLKKPHFCPWPNCHKSFTRSAHLARHIRSHGGEKPYACSQEGCGKHFSRSDVLKEHIRIHDVNKVRKRRGRNSVDQVKASAIKKNNTSSAAAAAMFQQNAAQLSAIPPPLRRRTFDGVEAAPSTTFSSLFPSNGQMPSTPYPQFNLQPLQQQPEYPYQGQNSPQEQNLPQYPSQQMHTMYGQEFAHPKQQSRQQDPNAYSQTQGRGGLGYDISAEVGQAQAQNCPWTLGPLQASSPPASDTMTASRKDSLASLTDDFSTMDYSDRRQPLSSRSYTSAGVNGAEGMRMMQSSDLSSDSFSGTRGHQPQQHPQYSSQDRQMSQTATLTYSISSTGSDGSPGQNISTQCQPVSASTPFMNPRVELLSMATIEELRVMEADLLQKGWNQVQETCQAPTLEFVQVEGQAGLLANYTPAPVAPVSLQRRPVGGPSSNSSISSPPTFPF